MVIVKCSFQRWLTLTQSFLFVLGLRNGRSVHHVYPAYKAFIVSRLSMEFLRPEGSSRLGIGTVQARRLR